MNPPTKVFIVDSDRLGMVTLSLWLEQHKDFAVVGTALPNVRLEQKIRESEADLVVLNLSTSGLEAVSTLRRVKQTYADMPVIVLHQGDAKSIEGPLAFESDAQLSPEASLKDLVEVMKKLGYRQKVVGGSTIGQNLLTKAG
jgi:DNA-binding NarL/FixJ family response regulator